MAINSPVKEVTAELIRELLIAISDSAPENLGNPKPSLEKGNRLNGDVVRNQDDSEDLRWDLMSISYAPAPAMGI